jgi:hypothetical protein
MDILEYITGLKTVAVMADFNTSSSDTQEAAETG